MKQYFCYAECSNRGLQIGVNWDVWIQGDIKEYDFSKAGSFRLMPARILGISYGSYLRWCQSKGARLIGKDITYSGAIFDKPNKEVLDILNERATKIFEKIDIKELKY